MGSRAVFSTGLPSRMRVKLGAGRKLEGGGVEFRCTGGALHLHVLQTSRVVGRDLQQELPVR